MATAGMPVVRLRGGVVHIPPECAGKEALRHSGGTLRKRENAGRFPQVPRYGEVVLRHEAMPVASRTPGGDGGCLRSRVVRGRPASCGSISGKKRGKGEPARRASSGMTRRPDVSGCGVPASGTRRTIPVPWSRRTDTASRRTQTSFAVVGNGRKADAGRAAVREEEEIRRSPQAGDSERPARQRERRILSLSLSLSLSKEDMETPVQRRTGSFLRRRHDRSR